MFAAARYVVLTRHACLQVLFSLLVQSSEGATYGVVPFVSKRSLGVVSGFVGAGGNAGSVITQALFFNGGKYEVRTKGSRIGREIPRFQDYFLGLS